MIVLSSLICDKNIRRLKIALLIFLLVVCNHTDSISVSADPPPEQSLVTVTFTPLLASQAPPIGFVLTVINDHNIQGDWTPNPSASGTLIVAKQGSYPTSSTDGVVVYNDTGTTFNDVSVSLDELAADMYYQAYSVQSDGTVPVGVYVEASIGGLGVSLLGLALLFIIALGLLIFSTISQVGLWGWISALFFILSSWWSYTHSLAANDFYYIAFIISAFMIMVAAIVAMYMAFEDRKAKREYKGSWQSDSEMSEGNIRNSQMTEHHTIARKKLPKKKFNPMKWAKY
jgi:hypothetical protein